MSDLRSVNLCLNFTSPDEAAEFFAAYLRGKNTRAAPADFPQVCAEVKERASSEETPAVTAEKIAERADAIDRAIVSKTAVQLAVKNKEKAVSILADFGVKAVKELTDAQLKAAYDALSAALKALAP